MSHNLAELPLSRRRALEREKQACLRLHLSRNRASERLSAPCATKSSACWGSRAPGDRLAGVGQRGALRGGRPALRAQVVARLKAAVDWQRQRAA